MSINLSAICAEHKTTTIKLINKIFASNIHMCMYVNTTRQYVKSA